MVKLISIAILFLLGSINANATIIVVIDGEKQPPNAKILLSAGYHEICFLFPQEKKYAYLFRLHNLEEIWKNSNISMVRYTNLGGGEYIFHGKIITNGKIIQSYQIPLEIKENFWEKWWFGLLIGVCVVAVFGLLIYFWFLYDFRQSTKTQLIRQGIAADLHDEVGANLSSITLLVGALQKKIKGSEEDLRFLLDKISDNSIESAALINDTIWALNPSFDNFERLLERIKSYASGLLSSNDVAFTVENNLTEKQFELSILQRRNLYLIIKEAINNAAKHASASKVFLKINAIEKGIKINIEDNGRGFNINEVYEGNGLKNYQLRAILGEIEIKVNADFGSGTSVEIFLLTKYH